MFLLEEAGVAEKLPFLFSTQLAGRDVLKNPAVRPRPPAVRPADRPTVRPTVGGHPELKLKFLLLGGELAL